MVVIELLLDGVAVRAVPWEGPVWAPPDGVREELVINPRLIESAKTLAATFHDPGPFTLRVLKKVQENYLTPPHQVAGPSQWEVLHNVGCFP